jgi:EAL domain-containing protein (putative c-di-GMP-specific phosphodiesterase class I)
VRIVMDDFGIGYSNLAALRRLPLHELKLANTFIQDLRADHPPDHTHTAILAALVELGHCLGLLVTAEGVETQHQANHVRDIGCDIAQGWYYAPPRPLSAGVS